MTTTITHLYDNVEDADRGITELKAAGLDAGDISLVANNTDKWYRQNDDVKVVEAKHDRDRDGIDDRGKGAAMGASVGGTAVGALGLLAGLGVIAIPGIGPVVAAGWLTTAVAGAVAGGVTGGIVGALVQSGVDEKDADLYAEGLRRGGALVVARVPDNERGRYERALMGRSVDVESRRSAYANSGWKTFDENAPPYSADQVRSERSARI